MNRRSLLSMLGLAPLVAACRGPQSACSPVDGLMQNTDKPVCGVDLAGGPDRSVQWHIQDGRLSFADSGVIRWGVSPDEFVKLQQRKVVTETYPWREYALPRRVQS